MMLKIICVSLLVFALTSAILSDEEEWQNFKSLHHKLYESQNEETSRYEIFKNNLQKIREHNEKYAKGETTFKMGINKFSDMTEEEFKAIYGRGVLPPTDEENKPVYN